MKENPEASYSGGVVGTRIDLPFKERWIFTFSGRLGVYYLDSEYDGLQRTLLSPDLDVPTDWETSDSRVAVTLSLQTSLSATYLERVTFRFGTGVEYLSHTPKMRYANRGESFASGEAPTLQRISGIRTHSAFSAHFPWTSRCSEQFKATVQGFYNAGTWIPKL